MPEILAESLLRETGIEAIPLDLEQVATACGLRLRPGRGARIVGDTIHYDAAARLERQRFQVAHELGHFALDHYSEPQSERAASAVGAGLLVPRRELDCDLRRTWDIDALKTKYLVSAEMMARRICDLRDAVALVVDMGPVRRVRRYGRVSIEPTQAEIDIASQAIEHRASVRLHSLFYAVPVIDGGWKRAVVIADCEQLDACASNIRL